MTTIFLARHAVTDWNRDGRWQGRVDLSLNDSGREQARALARDLDAVAFSAIYVSDLRRAHETALVVAERRGVPVTALPELREIDVGSWTGLTREEIKERFPEAYAQFRSRTGRGWEGGETYAEMCHRVLNVLREVSHEHADDEVLVITHSGPIRAVHAHAAGLDFATDRRAGANIDHAAFSAVTVVDGLFRRAHMEIGADVRWTPS
jgi:broad specificity phosphatase PhoE